MFRSFVPSPSPRLRGCSPPCSLHPLLPAAEANAISENTETLHLSPQVATEYAGPGAHRRPEVCERSCEELGTMITELSGLHVIVNQLHENLRKVVGAWRLLPATQARPHPQAPSDALTRRLAQAQGSGGQVGGQRTLNDRYLWLHVLQDGSYPGDARVPEPEQDGCGRTGRRSGT